MRKQLKKSIRKDKAEWLKRFCGEGSWQSVKFLRKPAKPQQGRLRNLAGELVESDLRAETLAEHLEKFQWATRPGIFTDTLPAIWDELPAECGDIRDEEVKDAVKRLKVNKSSGPDGIVPEYFKALAATAEGLHLISELCRLCWKNQALPSTWLVSRVTLIFKKGDPAFCDNYRPITLLSIGCKNLASIVLARLKNAGAEARIWLTQFGFKSGAGTTDALFITRRILDRMWADMNGKGIFLALDWSKAFDSIAPDRLADALRRFGIPGPFIGLISNIYAGRQFFVKDMGITSELHNQRFGISQGCPLSPFLFIIVMTVLMHDAHQELHGAYGERLNNDVAPQDLLYADDTLLINTEEAIVQRHMDIVVRLGSGYGLQINGGKVELLAIRCEPVIKDGSGGNLKCKASIGYLGALVDSSGNIHSELNRRIGTAS